jgi:TfoX/Sxy family transcriptional regulator of competence genes
MKLRKSPPSLVELFQSVLPGAPVESRQMFGFPAAFVNGNMFMGLFQESFLLRLAEPERTALLRMQGAAIFEPMPGRPMKEYVVLPELVLSSRTALRSWVQKALRYGSSLPPKVKKAPAKKK